MRRTDIAVVGAGVAGASIAFHLAKAGAGRITLFERDFPASGASGRSGALVRMHYTNPHDTRLALESWRMFRHWDDLIGGTCGFHQTGFLWIVGPENVERLRRNVEMQQRVGVNTRVVLPAEIKELQPFASVEGVGAAAYEPDSGFADPSDTTNSLIRAGRALGVELLQSTPVTALRREGERVTGLVAAGEEWSAGAVVVAAGAWSGRLCATAGIDLPLRWRRLAAGLVFRPPELPPHMVYIDLVAGLYFRPDVGNHTLIGIDDEPPFEVDPDSFPQAVSPDALVRNATRAARRIPLLEKATLGRTWAGVDGFSPDNHQILGAVPAVEGVYLAVAGSGKGFKVAPATGRALAEFVTKGATEVVDLRAFRLSRFAEGDPIRGEHEYVGENGMTGQGEGADQWGPLAY